MKSSILSRIFLTCALLISPLVNAADVCTADEYVVGFFNGVWNDPAGAAASLALLKKMGGDTYDEKTVNYELFYNNTGSEVGATGFQDLAEVFAQRAAEIDPSTVSI